MKTVLITGANRGLGLELTKIFLNKGWRVIATCRNISSMPKSIAKHRGTQVVRLDVSNQKSIEELVRGLDKTGIDVLINNAGVYDNKEDGAPIFTELTDILKVVLIDGVAPRFIAENLLPSLRRGQEKLIVNISSNQGVISLADKYHSEHWPYGAGKASLNWSMATFSKAYPDIKSVLINPGWLKTRIGGEDAPLEPAKSSQKIYQLITHHEHKLPDGRLVDYNGKVTGW